MDRHPAPHRVVFLGVAGPKAIKDPNYNGLLLEHEEQGRIVELYSELIAAGQFPPLVVDHDHAQKIGIVRHLWVLSDGRLGILGEMRGDHPVARAALMGKTIGLSVSLNHPYDRATHRIVGDRRIHHVGVLSDPCWDDQKTWIKDISNSLEKIQDVFLQDYFKYATFMSQRDRAYWGQLLLQKQQGSSAGFAEGATSEPEGIIYLRTGFSKTEPVQFVNTAMSSTDAPAAAPPAFDEWGALAKEYGMTPEKVRAMMERSKHLGVEPEDAFELAAKKKREDAEAEERRIKEEIEARHEAGRQWIDLHAPYVAEADMQFMAEAFKVASLSGADFTRFMGIQTNASKARGEAMDHRRQEDLFQAERAKREAEEQARLAKEAAEAAKIKAKESAPAPSAPQMDYAAYYQEVLARSKQASAPAPPANKPETVNTNAGKSAPAPAFRALSNMFGIQVDSFDGSKFDNIISRGIDPNLFSSPQENSLAKMRQSVDVNADVYAIEPNRNH